MKSKKNRKTMKRIYHKISNKHKSKRMRPINKKYTHKGGGPMLAIRAASMAAKAAKKGASVAKKAAAQGASMAKSAAEQGASMAKQGVSMVKSAPEQSISMAKSAAEQGISSIKKIMPIIDEERDIKYYFKKGMYALYKVMRTVISLPIRNLDEAIPPELCKKMTGNDFVCSQTLAEYVLTGTKPDYKKMLLEKDEEKCLSFDENGNKIIKCKIDQTGGFQNSKTIGQKGGMIIGCDKMIIPKFKPNERVIVILKGNEQNENANAEHIEINGIKWFIGTVTTVGSREYEIQIDNGSIITRINTTSNKEIEIYNDEWKDFYKILYSLAKIILQDLYDIGYTLSHPFIKKFNQIMEIMYKKSRLYIIVNMFVRLAKHSWQSFDGLIKMDKDNIYVRSVNTLVSKYTTSNLDFLKDKRLRVKIIFISMTMIYNRYLNGKNIQQTLDALDDHSERIQYALGAKLKIIEKKLVKINLYLRKYECPMSKVESLMEHINDSALLTKLLESCNLLLEKETEYIEDDTKEKKERKTELCDQELIDYDLSILPDSTQLDFNIDPEKETGSCESCSGNKWAEVLVRYGCFFSTALIGNKNNMTHILINIVEDVATMNTINSDKPDPIVANIKKILQNIECRSNLRKVISDRIKLLKSTPVKS